MDQSCPEWDHNVALGVACGATQEEAAKALTSRLHGQQRGAVPTRPPPPGVASSASEPGGFEGELARYITPFRRRIGRWLTPATHMMPLLTEPNMRHCSFSLANPGWVNDFALRFSGDVATEGAPPIATTFLFSGGNFDAHYNENRTLLLPYPAPAALSPSALRKVELALILSGHGKMEFLPSTHTFEINGVAFAATSEGIANTEMGCTLSVRQGRAQPNEHGTWYAGRNFWCNGADVPVHSFDVTAAVAKRSPVNVTYHASGPGGDAPGKQDGGNIVLSSVLAWSVV